MAQRARQWKEGSNWAPLGRARVACLASRCRRLGLGLDWGRGTQIGPRPPVNKKPTAIPRLTNQPGHPCRYPNGAPATWLNSLILLGFPCGLQAYKQRRVFLVSASHGRTAANGDHPRGVRAEGMWPASAKTSPAVIVSHGVPAGRVLRCDTKTRFFRLTPILIKINKTAARAAGALLDGDQPLCEQRRHSRVALLPRHFFCRQGAVGFLGGAAARGRRRAAALSVARARARRRRARRVASTGGRRRAHAARSGPMGDGHHRAAVVPSLPPRATAPLCHRRTPPPPPRATPPTPPRRRFRHCASSSSYLWPRACGAPWEEVFEGHYAVLVVTISIAIRISTLGSRRGPL